MKILLCFSKSDLLIESSVIKSEPLSDYEDLTNGIDLSESSNDACSSSSFGNLEVSRNRAF